MASMKGSLKGQAKTSLVSSHPSLRRPPARGFRSRSLLTRRAQCNIKNTEHHPAGFPRWAKDALQLSLQRLGVSALGLAAASALLLGAPAPAPAALGVVAKEDTYLTFPVAEDADLFAVQKTLVEAWSIISETYVDPSFNNLNWESQLSAKLNSVAAAPSPATASKEISAMVAQLGDPFTRWVAPKEYSDFRISSDGELKGGVGLLIAQDPSSGRLMVLAPISGSPAEKAGILPGDEVLSVDGTSTAGWDGEAAARMLRGEQGSSVMVEVARRSQAAGEAIPGVPGLRNDAEQESAAAVERKRFRLRRERVELSPVFATTMHYDDHSFGYVRLVNFSQHAAVDMAKAIEQLKKDGVEGFLLDLRNNGGGLVQSSLDVASLWMDGAAHPTVLTIQDRAEAPTPAAAAPISTPATGAAPAARMQSVMLSSGQAATHLPMVVLVNGQSASASEILAGALHDNGRALAVIGDRTFGKGKIQSVFELEDGSAVFVTVAKYRTPAGTDIDKIGIKPDRSCSLSAVPASGRRPASVPGIPVGPGADQQVIEELETDACVLTAEAMLDAKVDAVGGGNGVPTV